jgi:hypothetical protein
MTWNLNFQHMREFIFPNNRVYFEMRLRAISFLTKVLALITYKIHTKIAFGTVDVSDANYGRPCNSVEKRNEVSQNKIMTSVTD